MSDWALILPSPLLSQLQGWPLCQKIQKNILQINLLSFCATIEPNLSKLQKIIKIEEKIIKNLCFLMVFWILFNLSSILAQKTPNANFSVLSCPFATQATLEAVKVVE